MDFYFYDLETTGLNPFKDRIMQFGGQRLDKNLQPLSEVEEFYVKLSDDILPTPRAIITHKILPQSANLEGLTEYQFLNWLESNVYSSSTVYGGYNLINFDNQFMRWLHWRNFAPPPPMLAPAASIDIYKLLRLAADLRPQGINWPEDTTGKKTNLTLGALVVANKIDHQRLHSAGADVEATIALARLIQKAQPKLFTYFLDSLQPTSIKSVIEKSNQPFVYNHRNNLAFGASTTLATVLAEHPTEVGCFIIYDLRQSPAKWQKLSAYDLGLRLKNVVAKNQPATPFSILDVKRAPVVTPLSVLDQASARRLGLDKSRIFKHWHDLEKSNLSLLATDAYRKLADKNREILSLASLESQLARSNVSQDDEQKRQQIRSTKSEEIANLNLEFNDPRFKHLQLLYQARNFPKTLRMDQLLDWEKYKQRLFLAGKPSGLDLFKRQLRRNLMRFKDDAEVLNILEELQLYIENILPERVIN